MFPTDPHVHNKLRELESYLISLKTDDYELQKEKERIQDKIKLHRGFTIASNNQNAEMMGLYAIESDITNLSNKISEAERRNTRPNDYSWQNFPIPFVNQNIKNLAIGDDSEFDDDDIEDAIDDFDDYVIHLDNIPRISKYQLAQKFFLQAEHCYKLKWYVKARKFYSRVLDFCENRPSSKNAFYAQSLLNRAFCSFSQKDYKATLDDCYLLLKVDDNNYKAWALLGTASGCLHDYDKAIRFLSLSLNLNEKYPWALLHLGNVYKSSGQYEDAIRCFEKLPDVELSAWLWGTQGYCYKEIEKYDLAVKCYLRALELDDQLAWAWYGLGISQCLQENTDLHIAIRSLTKGLEIQRNEEVFWYRGHAHELLGDWKEAISDFKEVLEFNPLDGQTYNRVAWIYVEDLESDFDEAIKLATKAVELTEGEEKSLCIDTLGWAYYKKRDYENAFHYIQQAFNLNPNNEVITTHYKELKSLAKNTPITSQGNS